ncbi:Fic family protein [Rhodococcoides kyotonense]|uniref:Cell filamentation protein Fic n=1 Tax=Rhodococcoides kyotonense TaxID=398843 RepID=A0A177Y8C2_9NOCA|nr:Fic family protein [Rhodococcus kyotonensis]OAK51757.1 cell filamentation protein Fic [Rhodococcus kyotonensis]
MANGPTQGVPAVEFESRPWHPSAHASRTQRRLHAGDYEAAIPASIGDAEVRLSVELVAESEDALREIVRFDEYASRKLGPSTELAPMTSILLRSESAASSQIENLTVGARSLALAELGSPSSRNASIVSGNVRAMEAALAASATVSAESVLEMHRALMEPAGDPDAGRWRTQQVWIGGSDFGPHRAEFVPPHHDRLGAVLDDFFVFASRTDLPVLPHIAIAHAQFETIHPFTDGNGRTGRALVHTMLRRAEVVERVTVPLSAGLLTDTASYFSSLGEYRTGNVEPIVSRLNTATFTSVANGRALVDDLAAARDCFIDRIVARRDSVAWRLVDALIAQPVIDNGFVQRAFGVSDISAQRAIDRLVDAEILLQTSKGRRNRVWQADEILGALDRFTERTRRFAT